MNRRTSRSVLALVAVGALAIVSCSSSGGSGGSSGGATTTMAQPTATTSGSSGTAGPATTTAATGGVDDFAWRAPATGDPIVIGMVNTEGTPGLDFPDMRIDTDAAADYLNQHGGFGGRTVKIEHCKAAGTPDSSQACAQELVGKKVDLVMLGLDVFPGYSTYEAAGIPVVGALPILPGDYTAKARFITGGNLTTMAAMVVMAVEHFHAKTAGIISADNPGSNASEAALTGALKKAGITYVSIKGGDNETDAGFQGLMRQATEKNPDVLFSLYSDAGCIGAMRARVALGLTMPGVSTPICAGSAVLDAVGGDAQGWAFAGVGTPGHTGPGDEFAAIVKAAQGDAPITSIGVGALGIYTVMTLGRAANHLAAAGTTITGAALYDLLSTSKDLPIFPNGNPTACGTVAAYPSVCSFVFPLGEYVEGGPVRTIEGFDAVSVVDYLP